MRAQGPRILIVDDSPVTRRLAQSVLEGAGYEVQTIEDPELASRAILRNAPDLVLMDLRMPKLSGDMAVELIRSSGVLRQTRIALFSSAPEEELHEAARRCGADGAITKPENLEELPAIIDAWFADHPR